MRPNLKVATGLPAPSSFAEWQPGCQEIQA
jgi:hypothetical protein